MIKFLLGISVVLVLMIGCRKAQLPTHYDIAVCTDKSCKLYEHAKVVDIRGDILVFVDEKGKEHKSIDDWKIMGTGSKIIFENPRFTNQGH